MEGGEGVTMTSNVAVPVSNVRVPESGMVRESSDVFQEKLTPEINERNDGVASVLFEDAKAEGVDVALERFAAEDELTSSVIDQTVEDEVGGVEEQGMESKVKPEETNPVYEKMVQLENRVSEVLNQNSELRNNLERTQINLETALSSIYALAQVIKEMAEKEEDDVTKMSILELLFVVMSNLMQAMIVPQKEDGVMQGANPEKQKEEKIIADLFGRVEKPAA